MAHEQVSLGLALSRGFHRKCPNCGEASAFTGYLTVRDACPNCHEVLSVYPCDDGPAYITILLVGHLVVGPLFLFNILYQYPPMLVLPFALGALVALTLGALPIIKGMFLALLWRLDMKSPGIAGRG